LRNLRASDDTRERAVKQLGQDFKKFILRGPVLDLAVAVVVGAAFNAVVQSFANDVIMGFVGAIFGKPNFSSLSVSLRGCKTDPKTLARVCNGTIAYGQFLTTLVNFLIIAVAVFLVIKTFEKLQSLRVNETEPEAEPLTRSEELLTEIRDSLLAQEA
jgi:large conductance mechanosensitive channel